MFADFFPFALQTSWLSAIPQRFSCRSFEPCPLPREAERFIESHSLPGIRLALFEAEESGKPFFNVPPFVKFSGISHYAAVIVNPGLFRVEPHLPTPLFAAGALGQAFILELTAQGYQACWVQGTCVKSQVPAVLDAGEDLVALIPFGKSAESTRPHIRKPLSRLATSDPTLWPAWAFQIAEHVRLAPSAVNSQPWRFDLSGNTLCIRFKKANSLNAGIAALHMALSMPEEDMSLTFSVGSNCFYLYKKDHA